MQHGILPTDPPPPPPKKKKILEVGQKVKIQLSDYGHVAYQIKGNHKYSNMVAIILPPDHHPSYTSDPGDEVKGQNYFFQIML